MPDAPSGTPVGGTLDPARMLEVLADDVAVLAAIDDADLGAPVAACPGWTVADLLVHLGHVHHRAVHLFEGGAFVPLDQWEPPPAAGPEGAAWAREQGRRLLVAARAADPDRPMATWLGDRTARFWFRRMMHEAAVHRWDAQAALGEPEPLPADVGVDGVDELLEVFCPRLGPESWATVAADGARSMHVHATDADGEWLVQITPESLSFTREHAKGDVAVRGRASALDLALWNRTGTEALDLFGDATVLDRFLAAARF